MMGLWDALVGVFWVCVLVLLEWSGWIALNGICGVQLRLHGAVCGSNLMGVIGEFLCFCVRIRL